MVGIFAIMRMDAIIRWIGSEISVEVMVERRKRANTARHHRHRVSIAPESLIKTAHLLVHHGVPSNTVIEIGFLRSGRKLTIKQEVTGL